ncbi:uncharacterized protein I303_105962 [Kwoniella dejecticola CBS 10117]
MRPKEHVLSQQVLEFLIEHQDHFLLGMELVSGELRRTAADRQKPKKKRKEKPAVPQPPPLVKADSDMMLPSESDDEAPAGGYYVIEGPGRPTSPASPSSQPSSTVPNISANLLPSPPIKTKIPPTELMEMSESDEDAPPGGYEVRTANPASARAALLAKPPTQIQIQSPNKRVPSIQQEAQGRSGAPTPATKGSSLARRKTVPARKPGDSVSRIRRSAKEAP